MSDIYNKLIKNEALTDAELYGTDEPPVEFLSSGIITLNCGCCGKIDKGFALGKITLFSAHSMLGKTIIGMVALRDAQRKGIFCVVLDAEYQWDWNLAIKIGIDPDPKKIVVYPNNQIEDVQAKIMQITAVLTKEEKKKIYFMLDSWGSLVGHEGVTKAQDPDSKKDFVLTQKKNNLANMILHTQCGFYITNGVYDNVGGFGELLKIPGGRRIILNAQTVILGMSKAKSKESTAKDADVTGSVVSCVMHKARYGRERKDFQFRINYDGGLDIFYGILDDAVAGGYVKQDGNTYFRAHIKGDQKWKEKNLYTSKFWIPIFKDTDFPAYLEKLYTFQGDFDIKTNTFYEEFESKLIVPKVEKSEPAAKK
jgi:hypothetical protein